MIKTFTVQGTLEVDGHIFLVELPLAVEADTLPELRGRLDGKIRGLMAMGLRGVVRKNQEYQGNAPAQTGGNTAQIQGPPCKIHGGSMKLSRWKTKNGKDKFHCTHKLDDGTYCKVSAIIAKGGNPFYFGGE